MEVPYDFELTDEEMRHITALDPNHRFNDPEEFGERAFTGHSCVGAAGIQGRGGS